MFFQNFLKFNFTESDFSKTPLKSPCRLAVARLRKKMSKFASKLFSTPPCPALRYRLPWAVAAARGYKVESAAK